MKTQFPSKKISFTKKTVVNLNTEQMNSAKAGTGIGWLTNSCANSYTLDLGCQS